MATIKRYATATGTRWEVRYRTPEGATSRKRGFTTKKAAEDWDANNKVSIQKGDYVAPTRGRVTVGELAPAWLERKKATTEPSHSRTLESSWKNHVAPTWSAVPVSKVTATGVKGWTASMTGAGCSATTVLRALGVLSGILDDAVADGRIARNNARGLSARKREKPVKPKGKHVYLDHDDVARLAAEAGLHRVVVLTLAYCGLRWGEMIALRVRHVDELRKRLLIVDNAVQIGGQHHLGTPKDDEPREVPVPAFVLAEIRAQITGRGPDDLVFGDGDRYMLRPKGSNGWFTRAVERAKVQRITPHDLRHTAASLAVSAGANVLAVSRMLGHENPQMTLSTYADLFDSDLDKVGTALDRAWKKNVSKTRPRRVQTLKTEGASGL
jgi:integrase